MSTTSTETVPSPPPLQQDQLIPGAVVNTGIGLLQVGSFLGRGAFGSVHSGQLIGAQLPSAVKLLPLRNTNERKAAEYEISYLRTISENNGHLHHIVQFQGTFLFGNSICLMMEKMSHSLYDHLQFTESQPFNVDQVKRIGSQMLTAVRFLHNMGVVHTDIKTGNVLVADTHDLQIKVADLGNAFPVDQLEDFIDLNCLQTLNYRAPEVLLGLELSEKMDIWSIGCVLAELYTGSMLFPVQTIHQLARYHFELFGLHESAGQGLLTKDYFKVVKDEIKPLDAADLEAMGAPAYEETRVLKMETIDEIVDYGRNYLENTDDDQFFVEVLEEMLNTHAEKRPSAQKCLRYEFFN